jgi:hypothetical protein
VFKMTVDVYSISPFPTASLCIGLFAFTAVDQLQVCAPACIRRCYELPMLTCSQGGCVGSASVAGDRCRWHVL